jgi:signal transduction histidine kinase
MLTEAIQMSRIEAGQLQLHKGPHSIGELAHAQVAKLAESLEGREVKVDVPETLPRVDVDPEFIGILISQFLNNAVQYTPPGSPLTIGAHAEGDEVVVGIQDQGPGISEPEQHQIFEKFYRGKENRERIPGTGMGLTIAREIVRAHQGRIWVESQPGKGSKFSFSVRRAPRGLAP